MGLIFVGLCLLVWILFFSEKKIKGVEMSTLTVTSSSFSNGHVLPKDCSCEGRDVSPHIGWSNVPKGTQSFTIICDDPDAPHAGGWVHWVIYDIPVTLSELAGGIANQQDLDNGARQGINSWGKIGYGGACPPRGDKPHSYIFTVYALDSMLNLRTGSNKTDVLTAQRGHVLAQGQIVGLYSRS